MVVFLTGCYGLDSIFFGDMKPAIYTPSSLNSKEALVEKIEESSLEQDYFGVPIFQMMLEGKRTETEMPLYYAMLTSFARQAQHRYLLVRWEKDTHATDSSVKEIKDKMREVGVPEEAIYSLTTQGIENKVCVYER